MLFDLLIAAVVFLVVVIVAKLVMAELEVSANIRKIVLLILFLLFFVIIVGYFRYSMPAWPPPRREW